LFSAQKWRQIQELTFTKKLILVEKALHKFTFKGKNFTKEPYLVWC